MRREFSKKIKETAFARANGSCEGEGCGARLTVGKYHYDHDLADDLGGEPVLENCRVLCTPCHKVKTRMHDMPLIAKGRRIRRREKGIKKRSTFACSRQSRWKKKITGEVVRR